jgi:hypothetical protein
MICALSIPCRYTDDPEVGVPELALDHVQRHALARHLDRVRVTQLVRREPAAHTGLHGSTPQLLAHARRRQRPAASAPVDHTEQPADRHLDAVRKPRPQQLPSPRIHPDLAALIALAVAHENRAAIQVKS